MASVLFIALLNHSSNLIATIVLKIWGRFKTMVEYSERLSAAMRSRGVSTQQLADRLMISYQAVKKVLDGKSAAFSAANNAKAARALSVSSEWLATGDGVMDVVSSGPEWPFGDYARYEALSNEKKEELKRIVDAFLAGAATLPEKNKSNAA